MKLKTTGLLLMTMLLAGCWQKSVHPFYTARDLVSEPGLGGAWTEQKKNADDDKMVWTFHDPTNLVFELTIRSDKEKHEYDAHAFRLDGMRFLDLVAHGREVSTMPVHHLFKIEELGATFKIAPLNIEWMQKWLRKNPGELAHVAVVDPEHRDDREQDELVLTADTKTLQKVLRTHMKDGEFWGETVTFAR